MPDARVLPVELSPDALAIQRQHIRLAFVAALLRVDVLGLSAAEAAEALEWTNAEHVTPGRVERRLHHLAADRQGLERGA